MLASLTIAITIIFHMNSDDSGHNNDYDVDRFDLFLGPSEKSGSNKVSLRPRACLLLFAMVMVIGLCFQLLALSFCFPTRDFASSLPRRSK